jgi:serine/threonine-protein kinase
MYLKGSFGGLPMSETPNGPVLRTVLVFDLAQASELAERLGTERLAEIGEAQLRLVRNLNDDNGAQEVETRHGRALLFNLPFKAAQFALKLHAGMAELSEEQNEDVKACIGAHLTEVNLTEAGNHGASIPDATWPFLRLLLRLAGPGKTLLTRGAFDLARRAAVGGDDAPALNWVAHGSYRSEGFVEPVEVFEVGLEGTSDFEPPAGSEAVRREDDTILGWRPAPGLEIPNRPSWVLTTKLDERGFSEEWLAVHRKTHDAEVFKFCFEADRLRGLQREVTIFRLLKDALGDRRDIARILDWNFEQPPYFVEAEYSKDGSLPEWLEEQGGIGEVSLVTRLEIVAQVADALSAAHSVGVLHKDIRPESILISVDSKGHPRTCLCNFGIGQITEWERLAASKITVMGFLPEPSADGGDEIEAGLYLAPELLEGKTPTMQADIYGLGVVLYQLVTGNLKRALAPGWQRDVDDEMLREDIAMMVDGRPERRLTSAAEAAQRLRQLEQRRTQRQAEQAASRQTEQAEIAAEQAHKRWRNGITIGVVLALLLLAFGVQLWRVGQRLTRVKAELTTVKTELGEARAATEEAEEQVRLLQDLFIQGQSDEALSARDLLDQCLAGIDRDLDEPSLSRARALYNLAVAYRNLDLPDQAEPLLQQAIEIARQHPETGSQVLESALRQQDELANLSEPGSEAR